MILIFVRTIIIYTLVLVVTRFMGKREIGQMQPFEFVIAIMIADLSTMPMSEIGIPILYGIIPILALLTMHMLISYLNLKSIKIREIICGKPTILINKGVIDENALIRENFTINELQEKLRSKDINNFSDVEFAILETSGDVNVILKSSKRALKPEDFNLETEYEGISYDLVIDGKIMTDNLRKIGKDYVWLMNELKKYKLNPKEALVVVFNGDGTLFYQKKDVKNR